MGKNITKVASTSVIAAVIVFIYLAHQSVCQISDIFIFYCFWQLSAAAFILFKFWQYTEHPLFTTIKYKFSWTFYVFSFVLFGTFFIYLKKNCI